jgi:nitrogen fixation protein FixH
MKRFLWPGMIFALIGMNVAVVVVTIIASRRDSSYALVPAYDRKAMRFQEELDRRAASAQLGWTATPLITQGADRSARIAFTIHDASGAPVADATLSVALFHHAYAAERIDLRAVESAPGFYTVDAKLVRRGLWRFELAAQRGGDHFETTVDATVGGSS